VNGDAGDDVIAGNAGADTLNGGDGNDDLDGGDGDDAVSGGDGNDTAVGGLGNDSVWGDAGDDLLAGGEGNDIASGGDGADTIDGEAGNDSVDGGDGDDDLAGSGGADTIRGGDGNDTMADGVGRDRLYMAGGDDYVNNSNDTTRDVFCWDNKLDLLATPEYEQFEYFDVRGARTNDVFDLSKLGKNLVLEVYGGGDAETGSFAVYKNLFDYADGDYMLLVEWYEQVGDGINVGTSSASDIRINTGWTVFNTVAGDTFF
jgi:hypothetical protein